MDKSPDVLVDSNVLIDIDQSDRDWGEWSIRHLAAFVTPCCNPVIFAELCCYETAPGEVDNLLANLGIHYMETPKAALFLASQAFKKYRSRGGLKTSPLPDFFIGGHAEVLGIPILTRDTAKYRTYFPDIQLVCPEDV